MWRQNAGKFLAGLALAALLLAWAMRGTDPAAVGGHLRSLPPVTLVLGLLFAAFLNIGHNVFRVLRWRALLEPVRVGVPFRPMFDAIILGYMTSWIIPGRLGEFVRPALLTGREQVPLGASLGSCFADRVLDGFAVVVMFGIGSWIAPPLRGAAEQTQAIQSASILMVGVVTLAVTFLVLASAYGERVRVWLEGRSGWWVWSIRMFLSVARGTDALRRPWLLARSLFYTGLAWGTIALATWIALRASGAEIPFGGVLVIMPLLVLGIALPTPGGAGGYHLAMKIGLISLYGVAEPVAVAAGILVHLTVVVPVILLGVLLLVIDRIPMRELVEAAKQVKRLGGPEAVEPVPEGPLEKTP